MLDFRWFAMRITGKFCKRFRISVQKKTNNKSKSVYERIHKVQNYHYYVIYMLEKETRETIVNRSY